MKLSNFIEKIHKIRFICIWDGVKRAQYLKKHNILAEMGNNCLYQSRNYPMDPKLLKIHNNVTIAANVFFVTHDAIRHVLNYKYKQNYKMSLGPIEIMDNVFIGLGAIIMPNVRINRNVIVAAGSVVTKDIPENSVVAGVPARIIGKFDDFVASREIDDNNITYDENIKLSWDNFNKKR